MLLPQGLACSNFTSAWKDPRMLCGMVNVLDPGSFDLKTVGENPDPAVPMDEAISIAETKFNVIR